MQWKRFLYFWSLELGYSLVIAGRNTTLGLAYQGSDDAGKFLPKDRYLSVVSIDVFGNTALALEYRRDEYENDDTADTVTASLAVAF